MGRQSQIETQTPMNICYASAGERTTQSSKIDQSEVDVFLQEKAVKIV